MNARDVIARTLELSPLKDDRGVSWAEYRLAYADAILTALGCDDGPVAIVAPDQPVRRLEVPTVGSGSVQHKYVWLQGFRSPEKVPMRSARGLPLYVLGPEVGEQ